MPQSVLRLTAARDYGTTNNTLFTNAGFVTDDVIAHTGLSNALGGFYVAPFELPLDFDPSYPADLYFWHQPNSDSLIDGQFVSMHLEMTRHPPDVPGLGNIQHVLKWPVPAAWKTRESKRVLVAVGSPNTYAAGTFTPGQLVGIRLARNGSSVDDTFAQHTRIADVLTLHYHRRCQVQ